SRFKKYWDKYLKKASLKEVIRDSVKTLSQNISYKQLKLILPEARTSLTINEIKNGKITDLIIDLLK
ncbi:MAG: hypothetical protein ACFFCM_14250, partial [Promethearchaeota archaeon]